MNARRVELPGASWIASSRSQSARFGIPGRHVAAEDREAMPDYPMPIFRKSFHLDDAAVTAARLEICGLGHFELLINGEKVGDRVMDPPWSNYARTCYVVTFDVSALLAAGENVLGVMLGNGMYNVSGGRYAKFIGSFGVPKLILGLTISQGEATRRITSDASWKTDDGPITFSCVYGGEDVDGRAEQPGWAAPGFDDTDWQSVLTVDGPGGELLDAFSPPVKARRIEPVSVDRLEDGRYEVDLGENLSSRPFISVKGRAGAQVTIETAERRGQPWKGHSYTFTLRGDNGPELFLPRFSYFSFQYLYLAGAVLREDGINDVHLPELIDVGAECISSCGPRIGGFSCSNPLLNEIDAMIDRSVLSNLQHVITDCPHREKLGWLEVSHLMGPSILFNYDMAGLFRKICRDTTDAQLDNGLIPDIAPEYVRFESGFFHSPEWASAALQLPWLLYEWHGDEDTLRQQYPTMKRYVEYLLTTRTSEGLVAGGLGDWFDWTPEGGHAGPSQLTPPELTATCMLHSNLGILRETALKSNDSEAADRWWSIQREVRGDFLAAYYDAARKIVRTGSQCALASGLYFRLVPEEDREAVLANLVKTIEADQYRPTTGEISFRYLIMALAEGGRSDVVYRMVNRTDAPGYGCMLKEHGLKTLSERWDYPGNSLNHCMFGHIQEWFVKYVLGIRQAAGSKGFERIIVDPYIPCDMDSATGFFHSPNGRIEVTWTQAEHGAEVIVRAERPESLVFPERDGVRFRVGAFPGPNAM